LPKVHVNHINALDVLERARSIGVGSDWALLVQKEAKTNEPISRAYERAESDHVVDPRCASSIRTHPVVQKEQGVSA
jgi:hypothetical protein